MKPYPKYKPTGIDWIGDIPSHWELKKLSHGFGRIGSGTTPSSGEQEYYLDGNINWLQTGDLTDGDIYFTSKKITQKALDDFSALKFFKPGSIVMAMYGATIGKMGILHIETTTNQACCVMAEPISFIPKYAFYWLVAHRTHIISLSYGGGQPNISQAIISSIRIHCPTEEEQTTIANYLDEKTTQIDKLIANKQKLIELLKEERTAVIKNAVTKGINPKVKLKPSEAECIGDIPQNWEVKKLKHIANVVLGKMLTNDDLGNYSLKPYLRSANIQWLNVNVSSIKEMWFSPNELSKLRIEKNDILVSEGGEVGRACIWKNELDECYIQNSVHKITVKENGNAIFLLFQFYYLGYIGFFDSVVNKISIGHLTGEKLKEIKFCFPSLKEQNQIAEFLQTETQKIDNTISKIEKEIELMQEYRTALISEVVTGKVDVEGYTANNKKSKTATCYA